MTECFKSYDIRGIVPEQLDEEIAETIGMAFAHITGATSIAIGHDPRLSSPPLARALSRGLVKAGVRVQHLGLCGTEEIYFASCLDRFEAGIMVTASHNPSEYNGMKFVLSGARPLEPDQFNCLRYLTRCRFHTRRVGGDERFGRVRREYFDYLQKIVGEPKGKRLKGVCNPGNGGASVTFPLLEKYFDVVGIQTHPNGHFPHGVPNPMIVENRSGTEEAVLAEGADFGVAWDGDFDRCFLFDENGEFVENYHLVVLLAKYFLEREPGAEIIHDPRLIWCIEREVIAHGGRPICARTGHVNLKAKMRAHSAVYGGEMSGHHYFRELQGFDSGILPVLLVNQILVKSDRTLSKLLHPLRKKYKISGEINFEVPDVQTVLSRMEQEWASEALITSKMDGLSMEFADWRFNLRGSNTEPLLRLNVEAMHSQKRVEACVRVLSALIERVAKECRGRDELTEAA